MNLHHPKAVLFDLDRTLTNRPASIMKYAGSFLTEYKDKLSPHLDIDQLSFVLNKADGGGYNHLNRSPHIISSLNWITPPSPDELDEHWKSNFPKSAVFADQAYDLLLALRDTGVRTAIVTNGSARAQNAKIDALGIRKMVETILISEEVGIEKPDKKIFKLALAQLALDAKHCLFIGDHPTNDIIGAHLTGMRTVWISEGRSWEEQDIEPTWIVESVSILPDLFLNHKMGVLRN